MIGVGIYPGGVKPKLLDLLYDLGVRAVRYSINGASIIKAPDAYDFNLITSELITLREAGMYAYVNWNSLPAFMTGGVPAYTMLGCWVPWKEGDPEPDLDPVHGHWRLARPEEKPYCHMPNVPDVDTQQVEAFTYALASELSDLIDWFGNWNEPDLEDFWPPIADPNYKGVGYTRLINQIHIPGTRGYRNGCTGGAAMVVGPESATPNGMRMLLELERESGLQLWDVLSGHLYSWTGEFPGDSFQRTSDFLAVVEELGKGRPFWDTETDDRTGNYINWYILQRALFGDRIRAHFRHQSWSWMEGGEAEFNNQKYVPNAEYYRMQRVLAGIEEEKRRAVRS